jgi:hypothetical protein
MRKHLRRSAVAVVATAALVTGAMTAAQPVGAQQPTTMLVFPVEDHINGEGWPDGASITLEIDDPSNGPGVDYTDTTTAHPGSSAGPYDPGNPGPFDFDFPLGGIFDVQAGHEVTINDGTTTKTHTVTGVTVTAVDPDADTISGTAAPGSLVYARHELTVRSVTAGGSGDWTADFSVPGGPTPEEQELYDIQPDSSGVAQQVDADDDRTLVLWEAPPPPPPPSTVGVDPVHDQISGNGWQDGATITLDIDDPANGPGSDYSDTTTAHTSTEPPGDFQFELAGVFDIAAGHLVSVSDGTTTKTHTVTGLTVTAVDPYADTVSGTAAPGSEVFVGVHSAPPEIGRIVVADGSGSWIADFSVVGANPGEDVVDLQPFIGGPNPTPASTGWASQQDDDGDSTEVNPWFAPPPPEVWVDPVTDDVRGGVFGHWPAGAAVVLEIDDPTNGPGVDYTDSAVAQPGSVEQFFDFRFALAGVFDIQPGHEVTVTDGTATKTLVVTDLTVTGFDFGTNTVSGTATPGTPVTVITASFQLINTQADSGTGAWSATVPPGAAKGAAYETDPDNDHTSINYAFGATIQGSVLGDGGAALPQSGAAICLGAGGVTIGCPGFQVAFADGSGNFILDGIPPGSYSVVGFQNNGAVISPVAMVDLAPDDVVTCTFTLGTNPSGSCGNTVEYDFDGFFAPVNNPPTLNSVKAGRAIPVKFSLGGDQGLDVLADGYPKSEQVNCDDDVSTDGVEETVTAGQSSLSYDAATGTYTYVWKTNKAWSDTCRQLVVKLTDGTVHRANFEFK